ncbi:MAG: Por secretion system protein, partial [Draconibacterium sp.]|nr:Por secretion system protein [Draconibacterium sp.]
MKYLSLFLFIIIFCFKGNAQITTNPALPVANQKVTITFDSSKESRLDYFTGDLYAHTGLITNLSTSDSDWKYVIESWGNNTTQPKLTNKGNGIYELEITPDINTYYSVNQSDVVIKMAFVFRSSDGSKQTNNLYINVYKDGLVIEITEPAGSTILEKNQLVTISARASTTADLKLSINETVLTQNNGTEITTSHTFTESGEFWLIAEATANDETVFDSLQVFVRGDVVTEPKPTSYKKGINYPSNNSAALVLWAPLKEFVFVVGDFNDWKPTNEFQMKKDGDFFWLDIPNLESGKEYIFQYLIDGEIKIADPYSEKISDPWNDHEINNETYPNLIKYPENKTDGIASILQPGQENYNWEIEDFKTPEIDKLVIYELL